MRQPGALIPTRRAGKWLVLFSCATLAGCFQYTAIPTTAVSPEEEVRVRVTTNAAIRIGPHLGTITENLEGRLTPAPNDSLDLSVWIGRDYVGSPFEHARQRVLLGRQEIVEVRRRTLSKPRTVLAALGVAAITAFIIQRVAFEEDPNPLDPDRPQAPPEPDFRRRR